jgi:hypothetical protein
MRIAINRYSVTAGNSGGEAVSLPRFFARIFSAVLEGGFVGQEYNH